MPRSLRAPRARLAPRLGGFVTTPHEYCGLANDIQNIKKHGVSFAEAVESFLDPDGFQLTDSKHSTVEKRLYWIGRIATGRVVTTRFTRRGKTIRIIGAAEWRTFRRLYHERTTSSSAHN